MSKPAPKFQDRAALYRRLWDSMEFDPGQKDACMTHARRVLAGKPEYLKVQAATGVPWWWVGIAHLMEAFCNFGRHIHNGDPLTARTRQVPAGRPLKGSPPFAWHDSAIDAVTMKGLHNIRDWSIERVLFEWERYNGWGYALYRNDLSPYLWARTNHNDGTGKYVADGRWDPNAPSEKQCGATAVLRCLMELDSSISFGRRPMTPAEKREGTAAAGGAIAVGTGAEIARQSGMPTEWIIAGVVLVVAIGIGLVIWRARK